MENFLWISTLYRFASLRSQRICSSAFFVSVKRDMARLCKVRAADTSEFVSDFCAALLELAGAPETTICESRAAFFS
jgi:hypothetical protein